VLDGVERKGILEQLTVGDEDIDVVTDKHKVEGHSKLILVLVYRGKLVYRFREKWLKNSERGYFVAAVDPALLADFDPKDCDDIPGSGKTDWNVGDWQYVEGTDGFLAMTWENACRVVALHNQEILDQLIAKSPAIVVDIPEGSAVNAAESEASPSQAETDEGKALPKNRVSLKGKISHWLVAFPASYI
jgi:hypothetical protein